MTGPLTGPLNSLFRPGRKVFYGWRIVAAGSLLQVLVAGLFLQAYGAYVLPIQMELNWSRTLLSAGFAIVRTESAILGPIQGHLIDRYGPRAIMRIGVALFGLGFIFLGTMQQPWHFLVAMVILALGASFAGTLSVTVAVVNWFRRHRSIALALATAGFALGGLVVPAVASFITTFGWRPAALMSGGLMLAVGPLAVQVVRHRPAELGLTVDGLPPEGDKSDPEQPEPEDDDGAVAAPQAPPQDHESFTAKEAMCTWAFWQLSLGHALIVMLVNALMVHLIPHLTGSLGYSLEFAAFMVAVVTVLQLVGKFLGGVLGDRMSKRAIVTVAMVMHGVGALVLSFATTSTLVILFALMHGLAWGARGPLLQAWRADLFGSASFGAIMGYSSILVMLGAAGGPLFAGILFDRLGSYDLVLRLLALLAAVGAVLFFLVRQPEPPEGALRGSVS